MRKRTCVSVSGFGSAVQF